MDSIMESGAFQTYALCSAILVLKMLRNDLENIPLFWVIGLLYVLSGASGVGAAFYCWTFTLARIAHTFAYANHKQPAHALLWGLGTLCIVGMAIQVAWRSL